MNEFDTYIFEEDFHVVALVYPFHYLLISLNVNVFRFCTFKIYE